ncbi:MAG: hypothetical protein JXR66_01940 [Bacteroidales bacterium]|nr:hypothetical protein [Bacteroidales bacterium]
MNLIQKGSGNLMRAGRKTSKGQIILRLMNEKTQELYKLADKWCRILKIQRQKKTGEYFLKQKLIR